MINVNTFTTSHEAALAWIRQQLSSLDLVVQPSFDLQVAKSSHANYSCPHHGTTQCNCQIVVLLVYYQNQAPISLVVHSQDGYSYLSMTGIPDESGDKSLADKIYDALRYQNNQKI
jgi:hypothetical protein